TRRRALRQDHDLEPARRDDVRGTLRGGRFNGQLSGAVVPAYPRPGALAFQVILADAVVLVQGEIAVRTTVHTEGRRLVHDFARVLPHRVEGDDGAGPDVDRHGGEVDRTRHRPPAGRLRVGPPVIPVAAREVDVAGRGPLLEDRRDQQVASPQV